MPAHPITCRIEGGQRVAHRPGDVFGIRVAFHALPVFPRLRTFQNFLNAWQLEVALALVQIGCIGAVTDRLQPLRYRVPRRRRLSEPVQKDAGGHPFTGRSHHDSTASLRNRPAIAQLTRTHKR